MTRFTFWTAAILLTFAIRPALGASEVPGEESPNPIHAEELILETDAKGGMELRWTVVDGTQVSYVVRFARLEDGIESIMWEGSIETSEPSFDIVSDGPEWLADELTAATGVIEVELTLIDRCGEAGAPVSVQFRRVSEDAGAHPHESDQGVAAWSDEGTIEVEWTTYDGYGLGLSGYPPHDSDEGLAAWGEINAIDVEWNSYGDPGLEMADEPTHEVDQGIAVWGDVDTIEVEWTQYE